MHTRWLGWLAIGAALAGASGCVRVRPWERDTLAGAHMQLSPNPAAAELDDSMRDIMEGGTFSGPGPGGSGAGCGCH